MNQITAQVQEMQSVQNLNILTLTCKETPLKMITLDFNEIITKNSRVVLTCKPVSVAIGKDIQGELSFSNRLHVKIISLEVGQLLCALQLQFGAFVLESVITTDAQKRMQLQIGDEVIALIQSTDLSIAKVLS